MKKLDAETLERLRVRIAELCGMKHVGCLYYAKDNALHLMPDYPNSLDAAHAAWSDLTPEQKDMFREHAHRIVMEFYEENLWLIMMPAWAICIALDRTLSEDPII